MWWHDPHSLYVQADPRIPHIFAYPVGSPAELPASAVELIPLEQRRMALTKAIYNAQNAPLTGLRLAVHIADAVIRDLCGDEAAERRAATRRAVTDELGITALIEGGEPRG